MWSFPTSKFSISPNIFQLLGLALKGTSDKLPGLVTDYIPTEERGGMGEGGPYLCVDKSGGDYLSNVRQYRLCDV